MGAVIAIKADVFTVVGGQTLLDKFIWKDRHHLLECRNPLTEVDEQFFDDHRNINVVLAAPLLTSGACLSLICL